MYWSREGNTCVSSCPESFDDNRGCVLCAEKNVEHPYWDAAIALVIVAHEDSSMEFRRVPKLRVAGREQAMVGWG